MGKDIRRTLLNVSQVAIHTQHVQRHPTDATQRIVSGNTYTTWAKTSDGRYSMYRKWQYIHNMCKDIRRTLLNVSQVAIHTQHGQRHPTDTTQRMVSDNTYTTWANTSDGRYSTYRKWQYIHNMGKYIRRTLLNVS